MVVRIHTFLTKGKYNDIRMRRLKGLMEPMFSRQISCVSRHIAAHLPRGWLGQQGVGAVEFALILPIVLLLIVSIVEMSNVYFMRNEISEITRDVTRRLAVGALDEDEAKAFALKRLAKSTNATGSVAVTETEVGDVVDVSVSLSVPFADVLLFDQLIENLWSGAPQNLSVEATMMKN